LGFWNSRFRMLVVSLSLAVLSRPITGQTYKVNPGAPAKSQEDNTQASPQKPLGWGSNIQTARLARAAEMALKSGHYAAAVDYAQRATDSSPNEPQLWFLLEKLSFHSTPTTMDCG
jgi:Flp pilus assembly protein TadD